MCIGIDLGIQNMGLHAIRMYAELSSLLCSYLFFLQSYHRFMFTINFIRAGLGMAFLLAMTATVLVPKPGEIPGATGSTSSSANCRHGGENISLVAFRDNSITNVGARMINDGELIYYQATLWERSNIPDCKFQGGVFTITTPDGVTHDITPEGGIPLLGSTGVTSLQSRMVPYLVNHKDESPLGKLLMVGARADYRDGITDVNSGADMLGPTVTTSRIIPVVHTPSITTVIQDDTQKEIGSASVGARVFTVSGIGASSGSPLGTITFRVYDNERCGGAPSETIAEVPITEGVATLPEHLVSINGFSVRAHYNGEEGVYTEADGHCASVSVLKLTPALQLNIEDNAPLPRTATSALQGSVLRAKAVLSGGGVAPTGTLDFVFYKDAICSTWDASAGVDVALSAQGVALSTNEGPLASGLYSFRARYEGDRNYAPIESSCTSVSVGTGKSFLSSSRQSR